jgi:hypothetical protein
MNSEQRSLRNYFIPTTGKVLAIWLLLYFIAHAAIRLIFSDTIQLDDAEQIVLGQELALGYYIPQPPLYTWIYRLVGNFFGEGLAVLTVIKYSMIAAMFVALWGISAYLFNNSIWRIAVTLSFLLLHVFAWHMHVGFTHTIAMMLACAMTFHGFLLLTTDSNWRVISYLSLAIAIGLLSKYGYHLYLLTLLAACLSLPEWRRIVLQPKPILALACALILATPYHVWLYEHRDWLIQSVARKFVGEHKVGIGWLQPEMAMLEYLSPLILIMFWVEPRYLKYLRSPSTSPAEALLSRFHLLVFGLLILATMTASLDYFKARWMTPFMFLMPFWLLVHLQQLGERKALRLVATATTLSLIIFLGRTGDFIISPYLGREERVHLPIVKAIAELPDACRQASAVLAVNNFIAAHVRTSWPDKVVYSLAIRPLQPVLNTGQTIAVLYDKEPIWGKVFNYLESVSGGDFALSQIQAISTVEAYNQQTRFVLSCSLLEWKG